MVIRMWNIYDFSSLKDAKKQFNFVHEFLKYKVVVPLSTALANYVEKRIDTSMTYSKHTKMYFVIEHALENTKKIWKDQWACETYKTTPRKINKHLIKQFKIIDNFKKVLFAICRYDTAYDAFIKIFAFELTKEIQLKYAGENYTPLYCSRNINDMSYMLVNEGYAVINNKKYIISLKEVKTSLTEVEPNGNNKTKENE